MGELHYAAVTGDLVASRKATRAARATLQRRALDELERLNAELAADLVRPAVWTAGDEVQALLSRPSRVVELACSLEDGLSESAVPDAPAPRIVFGVGWGALSTGPLADATTVEHLDGDCFHHAREALSKAKKQRSWARFEGFGDVADATLTSLFELMGAVRSDWTPLQREHTVELRRLGKRIEVARLRGVSPSVITESLQLAHFDVLLDAEAAARLALGAFDEADA